ncbi:hypothetical protein K4L06_08555 [Lysobacter sp. BMK333-48F3]|uniref:hypothetical protein n=1 Tax=Lysobacter sp. BMK333-48F3 TaxID=2867962 RepID=UPI001C8C88A9|nr:hypothetical protein [Lysobacter sp. BMK333-48F3]MBX9401365.1 hypothetical protein [Lysobacter sp. BMK333-48F3]
MNKRVLNGCLGAAGLLLLFAMVTKLSGLDARQMIETGAGAIPLLDILAALVAMGVGGAIARHANFRWIALLLMVAMWSLTLFAVVSMALPDSPPPMRTVFGALRYNAIAIVATVIAAFAGAVLGERLGLRRFGAPAR